MQNFGNGKGLTEQQAQNQKPQHHDDNIPHTLATIDQMSQFSNSQPEGLDMMFDNQQSIFNQYGNDDYSQEEWNIVRRQDVQIPEYTEIKQGQFRQANEIPNDEYERFKRKTLESLKSNNNYDTENTDKYIKPSNSDFNEPKRPDPEMGDEVHHNEEIPKNIKEADDENSKGLEKCKASKKISKKGIKGTNKQVNEECKQNSNNCNTKKSKRRARKFTQRKSNKKTNNKDDLDIKNVPKTFGNYLKKQCERLFNKKLPPGVYKFINIRKTHHTQNQILYNFHDIYNLINSDSDSRLFVIVFLRDDIYSYLIRSQKIDDPRRYIQMIEQYIAGCKDYKNFRGQKQKIK